MKIKNQGIAALGLVLAGSACGVSDSDGPQTYDGPLIDKAKSVVLDAAMAKELDLRKIARTSDGPNVCYSVGMFDRQIKRLDMVAETITPVANLPAGPMGEVTALGHFKGALVACQGFPGPSTEVAIYDLDGSSVKTVPMPCRAITGDGERLWVMEFAGPWSTILEFTSFSDLVANQPSRELPAPPAFSLGVGLDRNRLIGAWHSTNEVTLVDLDDGTHTIAPLESYDNWIFGSAETADRRFVVGGWAEDSSGVHVFDPDSNANLGRLFADETLSGLTCDVR